MSKSYKHTPICKCGGNRGGPRKFWKRQANIKVRKTKEINKKSAQYKKIYESWHIRDYRFYRKRDSNMDDNAARMWERYYYRK